MSSALKREAWVKWSPKRLFTNQYIIIIGPAGIVKKTTAVIGVGLPVLRSFRAFIKDRQLSMMKDVKIVKDKVTPEAMINSIVPENKDGVDFPLVDSDGTVLRNEKNETIKYKRTSEVALIVSELSTMISKSSYSEGMVQILLDLYDCHDDWDWSSMGRGTLTLRNLHTTLLAGTTIEGLRNSIPAAAIGDGFLSRVIPVFVSETLREYPHPFVPEKGPNATDIAKALAFVVENTQGEFVLDDEAEEEYCRWYAWFAEYKRDNPGIAGILSRMDVNVLKTALLMRAQRYEAIGNVITKADFLDAVCLIDKTYRSLPFLLGQTGEDDLMAIAGRVQVYMMKRKTVTRPKLLSAMRIGNSDLINMALNELISQGRISVTLDGTTRARASGFSKEQYFWIGDKDDGDTETSEAWSIAREKYVSALHDHSTSGKSSRSKPHSSATLYENRKHNKTASRAGDSGVVERDNKAPRKAEKGGVRNLAKGTSGGKAAETNKGHHGNNRTAPVGDTGLHRKGKKQ